jgi:hypothetical protein
MWRNLLGGSAHEPKNFPDGHERIDARVLPRLAFVLTQEHRDPCRSLGLGRAGLLRDRGESAAYRSLREEWAERVRDCGGPPAQWAQTV